MAACRTPAPANLRLAYSLSGWIRKRAEKSKVIDISFEVKETQLFIRTNLKMPASLKIKVQNMEVLEAEDEQWRIKIASDTSHYPATIYIAERKDEKQRWENNYQGFIEHCEEKAANLNMESISKELRNLEIQVPEGRNLPPITLQTLVDEKLLSEGTKIFFKINGITHSGVVRTLKNGDAVLYNEQKDICSKTPHGFIKAIVGEKDAKGKAWKAIYTKPGESLKIIKDRYIKRLISSELIKIPGVWLVDFVQLLQFPPKWGFLIKVGNDVKIEKLKEDYPLLRDSNAIRIEVQEQPHYKAERNVQAGAKLGLGTLGCFCSDQSGNHYAMTACHVVDVDNAPSQYIVDDLILEVIEESHSTQWK